LTNYILPTDKIRISYQTGDSNNFNDSRDFIFKINDIPTTAIGQSIPIHVINFNLVDERFYKFNYQRYNKFYNDTKTNILTDMFKIANQNLLCTINDINKYSFYALDANMNDDIKRIRRLGDEPVFIYCNSKNTNIYASDMDNLLKQASVIDFKVDNSIGRSALDTKYNLNSVTINSFYNLMSDASGYKLYTFDVDAKIPSLSSKYIPNDDFYSSDRLSSMKTTSNCAYKENYYMRKYISAEYPFTNTSLNIGDVVNLIITKAYDNKTKTELSTKYIIYYIEETIDFENMVIGQNFVFITK
jgi:hypothetical protein